MASTTLRTRNNPFKNTLFESVSHQPWHLEYKMVFVEAQQLLAEAIDDLCKWYAASHRVKLSEADEAPESPEQTIARFQELKHLSPEQIAKLKGVAARPDQPPGLLNKFFNLFKSGIERLKKIKSWPDVKSEIDSLIAKINQKIRDNQHKEYIQPFLKAMRTLSDKTSGWGPSVILLALGIVQSLLGLSFIGGMAAVPSLIFLISKVAMDVVNGASVDKALAKAASTYGLGLGVGQLFDYLWSDTPKVPAAKSGLRVRMGREF